MLNKPSNKENEMSKKKRLNVAMLAACLMVAAAPNTQAHQHGSIGSNNSEYVGPFSFLFSLFRV
jgi:hypothetical protein